MNDKSPSFLYVEDDAMSQKVLEMLIVQGLGYKNITILASSANFIEQLEKITPTPDVIFLDIHVQPHNGFEMLKMLREHKDFANVTVIALTASVMNDEVAMLHTAGFDGGISKPINQDTFAETIQQILDGETVWNIS